MYLIGNDLTFATNVSVSGFSLWTESGTDVVNQISNVFATPDNSNDPSDGIETLAVGATPVAYTSDITITASPTGWIEPTSPTWAVASTGYGSRSIIFS